MGRFQRPAVGLTRFGMRCISHKLLTQAQHFDGMHGNLGERFFGAVQVQGFGRPSNPNQIRDAQAVLEDFADGNRNGLIQDVNVNGNDFAS